MAKTQTQEEKGNILQLELKLSKSTKGTHKFESEKEGMSVYIPKRFFDDEPPATVTLTIS